MKDEGTFESDTVEDATNLPSPACVLDIDFARYQSYLDASDMTPAQKEAFLKALWTIIVSFVDLGFGVHPAQQIREAFLDAAETTGLLRQDTLGFEESPQRQQEWKAAASQGPAGEGRTS